MHLAEYFLLEEQKCNIHETVIVWHELKDQRVSKAEVRMERKYAFKPDIA
jgi:hypothetical protein